MKSHDLDQADIPFFSPDSHGINIGVATQTKSMAAAVLLNHIFFWLKHNNSKNIHQIDGRTWMFQSATEMAVHFPYLTCHQIRDGLKLLVQHGYLLSANHSRNKLNRTAWYAAFREEWIGIKKMFPILPVDEMHSGSSQNGFGLQTKCYKDKDIDEDIEKNICPPSAVPPASQSELTHFFFATLQEINPKIRPPDFSKWAKEMHCLQNVDKRSEQEVRMLINYLKEQHLNSTQDFTWSQAVCSPSSLRKHFATIWLEMQKVETKKAKKDPEATKQEEIQRNKAFAVQKLSEIQENIPPHIILKATDTEVTIRNRQKDTTQILGYKAEKFMSVLRELLKKEGLL